MSINPSKNSLIYQNKDDTEWELTWPIWHMLSRDERKSIAIHHGMKTIGEFEEYMSLTRAEEISSSVNTTTNTNTSVSTYPNKLTYVDDLSSAAMIEGDTERRTNNNNSDAEHEALSSKYSSAVTLSDDDDDEDAAMEDDATKEDVLKQIKKIKSDDYQYQSKDIVKYGGILRSMPEELIHKVLSFLEVDYYYYLSQLHPIWELVTKSNHAYQILCRRSYLQQSKRKTLNPSNFQNSYQVMYNIRPRVKTGAGLYILKYAQVRKIQRDMFTEIPHGVILEVIYYRYLYFLEDGIVLYALTSAPPMEVIPKLRFIRRTTDTSTCKKQHLQQHLDHNNDMYTKYNIVWGTYEVSKFNVDVYIQHAWCHVLLQLNILRGIQVGIDGIQGRFRVLELEQHLTSKSGDCWRQPQNNHNDYGDVVRLCTPTGYFRFLTDCSL